MSFKLKLVVYFVLLALLPLAAAFLGFGAVAQRSEMRLADARLEAGLRAGVAAFRSELSSAQREAGAFARSRLVQEALVERDRAELRRLLQDSPRLRVETADGLSEGATFAKAAERAVVVIGPEGIDAELGVIVASVRIDDALARRLQDASGLPADGRVVVVQDRLIAAGPRTLGGSIELPTGGPNGVRIGGTQYRGLAAEAAGGVRGVSVAVLLPQSAIDSATRSAQHRLLLVLLAVLGLVALVAYLLGRSSVRTLDRLVAAADRIAQGRLDERVEVGGRDEFSELGRSFNEMAAQLEARVGELETERRRLRAATLRFGEALAATHDEEQLLRTFVETAVESTGATGGEIVGRRGPVVRAGTVLEGRAPVRAAARGRPRELRDARPAGPAVLDPGSRNGRAPRRARVGRAGERPPAPARRAAGARGRAHRPRQPPARRGGAVGAARPRRARRRLRRARVRRPRRVQERERRSRPPRRRRRPLRVRRGAARVHAGDGPRGPVGRRRVRRDPSRHRRRRGGRRSPSALAWRCSNGRCSRPTGPRWT